MGIIEKLQLISAAKSGDAERVRNLISGGADPEATSTQGFSCTHQLRASEVCENLGGNVRHNTPLEQTAGLIG